jgi:hypothetical protein
MNAVDERQAELITVRVFEEVGDCIVCLEIRADELMRHLNSGELTNYSTE